MKDPTGSFFQLVINQQETAYNKVIITIHHFSERLRSGWEFKILLC
jgi:hypothetical protein